MTQDLICIGCPLGCNLRVVLENGKLVSVEGHTCPRGEAYAHNECLQPARMVTTSLPVVGGKYDTVPVKSSREVPKDKVMDCLTCLRGLKAAAPVRLGQVMLANIAGTNADFIATRNIPEI